jgi:hypothetical protein
VVVVGATVLDVVLGGGVLVAGTTVVVARVTGVVAAGVSSVPLQAPATRDRRSRKADSERGICPRMVHGRAHPNFPE